MIATENISAIAKSKFVNITYQVPAELVGDKEIVRVKVLPHVGFGKDLYRLGHHKTDDPKIVRTILSTS